MMGKKEFFFKTDFGYNKKNIWKDMHYDFMRRKL